MLHRYLVVGWIVLGLVTALCCSLRSNEAPPTTVRSPATAPDLSPEQQAEIERAWEFITDESKTPGTRYWWWEAEHPERTNFPKHHAFEPEDAKQAAILSGGKWIGASDAGKRLFLEYRVEVPEHGTYQLHARKFWSHGPFRWRFDGQAWRTCDTNVILLDAAPLRLHVEANWVELGDVELTAGAHTFRIELLEPNSPVAFDAFVLTRHGFTPRGKLTPDQPYPTPPPGWVTFESLNDDFAPTPIDLRSLNHERAGDAGFVQVRGDDLVFQTTGEVARFWGMNAGHEVLQLSAASMRRYARRQAKFGVNLVRLHGPVFKEDAFRQFDAAKLERLHLLAAALKDEGIYLALSVYFPIWVSVKPSDGFPGYDGEQPFSLAYFSERFQAIQRDWWRKLLEPVNPHTGLSLANDPALAIVELVNEDSTLFWTFQPYGTIPEAQSAELERQFASWLIERYGDLDRTYAHWKSQVAANDNPAAKRVAFLGLWDVATGRSARAQDTAEFLTRSMRQYYEGMHRFLRQELGVRAPTVCSNWMTVDSRILGPLDDWANAACDIMDRHGYHSGHHDGDGAAYAVRAGHEYEDRSALRVDFSPRPEGQEHRGGLSLPFVESRINGKPSMVSELGWTWPNRFRAEGPLLTALYGSLHGLDAPVFFASSEPNWVSGLGKFSASEPATMGTFPAAARAFRAGMIQRAAPVVRGSLTERALFALNGVPLASAPALDNLRAKDVPLGKSTHDTSRGIDPLATLVGPVEFTLGANDNRLEQNDLAEFVNTESRTVRSITGELLLRYGDGLLEVTAPSIEVIAGFVGRAGVVELPNLSLELSNEYATVALIALDGATLRESKQLLLQIVTEVSNSDWQTHGEEMQTVDDPGGPPILVRAVRGHFELKDSTANGFDVVALNANGSPTRRFRGGSDRIPLLPTPLYYVITR